MNNQHMYLLGPESIEPLIGHSILGNNVKVESSRSFGDPGRSSARRWASSGYRRSITNRFELRKDHRRPQLSASACCHEAKRGLACLNCASISVQATSDLGTASATAQNERIVLHSQSWSRHTRASGSIKAVGTRVSLITGENDRACPQS